MSVTEHEPVPITGKRLAVDQINSARQQGFDPEDLRTQRRCLLIVFLKDDKQRHEAVRLDLTDHQTGYLIRSLQVLLAAPRKRFRCPAGTARRQVGQP